MRAWTILLIVVFSAVGLLLIDRTAEVMTGYSVVAHLLVLGFNNPPVLEEIGNQTATEGFVFTLTVTATDADSDNLTFSDDTSLFNIQKVSQNGTEAEALINFTPALSEVGHYIINVSVSDQNASDWEVFNLSIVRGLFCGDDICSTGEDCGSCAADCGACPTGGEGDPVDTPADGGTDGDGDGTGGVAGVVSPIGFVSFCEEEWVCLDWNDCLPNGTQSRTCTDINECRTDFSRPETQRFCEFDTGFIDTCRDGIQNEGEEGVDCGGPCAPCVIQRFAQVVGPPINLPTFARLFPWILILITLTISSAMTTYDRVYLMHLRKLEFKEFRARMARYVPLRRRLYTGVVTMITLSIVYATYFYIYSLDAVGFRQNIWIPGIFSLIVPVVAYNVIKQYEYSELKHKIATQRLERTHQRQIWQVSRIEIGSMVELEQEALHGLAIETEKASLAPFKELQDLVLQMLKLHEQMLSSAFIDPKIKKLIATMTYPAVFTQYPEFKRTVEDNEHLKQIPEGDIPLLIEMGGNIIDSVQEVAKDKLLITVIENTPETIETYNELVEIHDFMENFFENRKKMTQDETSIASSFIEKFKALQDSPIIQENAADKNFAATYNTLVDLYDHYELRSSE